MLCHFSIIQVHFFKLNFIVLFTCLSFSFLFIYSKLAFPSSVLASLVVKSLYNSFIQFIYTKLKSLEQIPWTLQEDLRIGEFVYF